MMLQDGVIADQCYDKAFWTFKGPGAAAGSRRGQGLFHLLPANLANGLSASPLTMQGLEFERGTEL